MGGTSLKVGVYTRFWNTAGGGEVYAGALAEVLAERHDVFLLSEEPIDGQRLRDRLGLSLEHLPQHILGELDDDAFAAATGSYDVFLNCSHGSRRPTSAAMGIYVVHFPDVGSTPSATIAMAALRRRLHRGVVVRYGEGIHPEETDGRRSWRWTSARAEVLVTVPPSTRAPVLEIDLSTAARPEGTEAPVTVTVDGQVVATHAGSRGPASFSVVVPAEGRPVVVAIETVPFSPPSQGPTPDPRQLGVQLEELRLVGRRAVDRLAARLLPPTRLRGVTDDFLDSYGTLVSNSAFTQRWLRRRWGRRSVLIEPPVDLRRPAQDDDKDAIVLSVGRFFGPDSGHSKRQLEMVEAFRRLAPSAPGWELHLVGGSSPRDASYLESVQRAAAGAPVRLHVNAPRAELDDLYHRASVYWHAAGLGEDERRHPERFEHFGISVVEAMSAGAVPVVLGVGGPAQVVRRNRDGLHFSTVDELIAGTLGLLGDGPRRRALAASAVQRAGRYGRPRFAERIHALVDEGAVTERVG